MGKKVQQTQGYGDIPLRLAEQITSQANGAFEDGTMHRAVTPTTAELLTYWFGASHSDNRDINFHEGQRQAILNVIYLHEVLRIDSVMEIYNKVAPDLLTQFDFSPLAGEKYDIAKYAIKMATGTGKTWVMHAILIWQILNSLAENPEERSGRFTKNFLLVAPGIIVYERLLDAYKGKELKVGESRSFETSDIYKFRELFIPQAYRDKISSFVQNNVVEKQEISRKITGNGLIAITNWHLFNDYEDTADEDAPALDDPEAIVKAALPIRPGTSGGNALDALDRNYLRGTELEYLADFPDMMVINDEAHHIHEIKKGGEVAEVEWQRGLSKIAESKGKHFFQIDFSATPYDESGSENRRVKHYFPHIVVDFDIRQAIAKGLVKTVVVDKRQEITEDMESLDFRVVRDNGKAIGLSEGQRLMLRAGLKKLQMLEEGFVAVDATKHPKMLVVCEDTNVSPFVQRFLEEEGLTPSQISRIDSNAKGELKGDWSEVKQKLFNIDSYAEPRVIISVLMLREGFDVNNICVIVPLRASTSQILLEQTLGRGLRLMWRGRDYEQVKRENRERVMVQKQAPTSYIDILSIIEHPKFLNFYDDLIEDGLVGATVEEVTRESVVGDLIKVGLKEDYTKYDLHWINIIHDSVEKLQPINIEASQLSPMTAFSLETLQGVFAREGESFISEELTAKTRFGEYRVTANLFTAASYSEYLQKLYSKIASRQDFASNRSIKRFPVSQIGGAKIIALLDQYIRERLFDRPFDPAQENNWKILFANSAVATGHIITEVANAIYKAQQQVNVVDAVVEKIWFSEVTELKMRETYSLPLVKTIYERIGYPSNKGGLECEFLQFLDKDASVERFIKIDENQHPFAKIAYIRSDGLLSSYHPDFMVCTADNTYIIETKGDDKVDDENVRRKQRATIEWCEKINALPAENRMGREWVYVLLSEGVFYSYQDSGATIAEICNIAKVQKPRENLFE